ncbi:MAG TPA: NADPH-dependent assimilatory sulfite reductase hemoprotein subunit, partial [Dehalococcoidia bacterium]|nr:NADPH-dependent assimilatory sulfite reductase hemoprotein subunit [Dehalococcoidia bacterium]
MDKNQKPSKVESIKEESRYLRGNLKEGLADNSSHFNEEGYQLLKFHGIYQQDDRSQRQQLKREGKDKAWMFMVRLKLPGGVMSPEQYLVCDDLSSRFANSTLRLTTRQDIQFHGILKSGLKPTIRQLNEALITTFGACGDVERNVMACPAPGSERVRSDVLHYAQLLSDHLLPRTRAYHEIWLNGEKIESSEPDHEPLYGKYYLPRKFKTAIAYAEDNCVDVYSNDMGFIADFDGEKLRGFDVLVGGGLGMTHGNAATYPRLAIPLAYVAPDKLLETAETIICIQRDYGDRSNRKHARLKYLVQEW